MATNKDIEDMTEEELVQEAQTGMRGQGAYVQMIRLLLRQQRTTDNRTKKILWFTAFITVLTLILTIFAGFQISHFFFEQQ